MLKIFTNLSTLLKVPCGTTIMSPSLSVSVETSDFGFSSSL